MRPLLALLLLTVLVGGVLGAGRQDAGESTWRTPPARMTGGGLLDGDSRVQHGFTLPCDASKGRHQLKLHWGRRQDFRLAGVDKVQCTDDPALEPGKGPRGGFGRLDTHEGMGVGWYNRRFGATVQWRFTDAGEPGRDDRAEVLVRDPDGNVVLEICGPLRTGNHNAHGRAEPPAVPQPGVDPFDRINSVLRDEDGRFCLPRFSQIPEDAVETLPQDPEPKSDLAPEAPAPVVDPRLQQLLAEQGPTARAEVIVTLIDNVMIPRFPDVPDGIDRDSPEGQAVIAASQQLADDLLAKRSESQEAFMAAFLNACKSGPVLQGPAISQSKDQLPANPCDLRPLETYWLINGFRADAQLSTLAVLEQMDEVVAVEPRFGGEIPPGNDPADARALLQSDPYFNLASMTSGYIGLLDTGVRPTHTLFQTPDDNLAFLRDCVNGGTSCNDTSDPNYNPVDDCWNHGTSSAAIVMGNANLGGTTRGVTNIQLDSWKVYPTSFNSSGRCNGGLDGGATVRGFQRGLIVLDRVFVGEMQSGQSDTGSLAQAADNAFDAGAIVVAANGNCAIRDDCRGGSGSPRFRTVRAPANAHKAIGVGNFDVDTGNDIASQSRGPTPDNRYKPDIRTPTNTDTASNSSDTATQRFTGTSGATPYAAGVAALFRNWLRKFSTFDPGATYAQMIQSGDNPWLYSNVRGAGEVAMPLCSRAYWGKVLVILDGTTIDIPIDVPPGRSGFDASLWWPEGAADAHDDIDLYILAPGKLERARGYSGPSVFERAQVTGPLTPGRWFVRIRAYDMRGFFLSPATVYWAADVGGCG